MVGKAPSLYLSLTLLQSADEARQAEGASEAFGTVPVRRPLAFGIYVISDTMVRAVLAAAFDQPLAIFMSVDLRSLVAQLFFGCECEFIDITETTRI